MSLLCLYPWTVGKIFKEPNRNTFFYLKNDSRRSPWHKLQPWWKKPLNVPKKRFPVITCLSLTFKLTPGPVDKTVWGSLKTSVMYVWLHFIRLTYWQVYPYFTVVYILIVGLQRFTKIRIIQNKQYFPANILK